MIKSFRIKKFKQFEDIQFENLNKINIFLGSNNAGKTTILESIFSFVSGGNVNSYVSNILARRANNITGIYDFTERVLGLPYNNNEKPFNFSFSATHDNQETTVDHIFEPYSIFADFKPQLMGSFGNEQIESNIQMNQINLGHINIALQGNQSNQKIGKWNVKINNNLVKSVDLGFPPFFPELQSDPLMLGRFVDILTHRDQLENTKIYSFLKRNGIMGDFLEELKSSFPNIDGIDSIPYPDGTSSPVSFKVKNKGLLPMYNFGDGVQRWYNILGGLILYQNAVHCIEEVDATFHPTAQRQLSKNLYKYAKKYNNQLFLTSHSIEFIDNLLQSIYEDDSTLNGEDIVRIITIKNDVPNNKVFTRVLTGKEAYETREKYQLELR